MLNLSCRVGLAALAAVAESRVFHSHPANGGTLKSPKVSVHGCGKLGVQFCLFLGREAQALLPFCVRPDILS
jgi:hypothetical protein